MFLGMPPPLPPLMATRPAVKVSDGDTVTIQGTRIRLACIDAPELSQPRGQESKATLQRLIGSGIPQVEAVDTDRYGRTVAVLKLNNLNLNHQMVRLGQAFVYQRYLHNCPDQSAIRAAESQAKSLSLGVWNDKPPEFPWHWRRK